MRSPTHGKAIPRQCSDRSKFVHEAVRDERDSKMKAMLQLAVEQLRIADPEIEKIEEDDGAGEPARRGNLPLRIADLEVGKIKKHDEAGDPARRGTSPVGEGAAPAVSTVGSA